MLNIVGELKSSDGGAVQTSGPGLPAGLVGRGAKELLGGALGRAWAVTNADPQCHLDLPNATPCHSATVPQRLSPSTRGPPGAASSAATKPRAQTQQLVLHPKPTAHASSRSQHRAWLAGQG